VPYSKGENTLSKYDDFGSSALVQQGSASELPTIFYPTKDNIYEYNTDYSASEIIFTPGHGLTTAYIRYLSNSIGNTSANLVNPYVTPVLFAYIDWMVAKGDGSPQSKVALLEDVYYNQKRILRGRMNPLSLSEMYRILITNWWHK